MPIIPMQREIRQVFHFYSINIESRQKRGACEVVTGRNKPEITAFADSGEAQTGHTFPVLTVAVIAVFLILFRGSGNYFKQELWELFGMVKKANVLQPYRFIFYPPYCLYENSRQLPPV